MDARRINAAGQGWQTGFGLIEQIVSLAVLAVLVAMAIPSFHRLLEGHELRMAQADYIAALQHARSLAVNEQVHVIFCPSRDARTCSGDDAWNQGWLIARADLETKGQPLGPPRYLGRKYPDTLVITGNGMKYIWFGPGGSSLNSFQKLSFCFKDEANHVLHVVIARAGRVRGEQETNAASSPCAAPTA